MTDLLSSSIARFAKARQRAYFKRWKQFTSLQRRMRRVLHHHNRHALRHNFEAWAGWARVRHVKTVRRRKADAVVRQRMSRNMVDRWRWAWRTSIQARQFRLTSLKRVSMSTWRVHIADSRWIARHSASAAAFHRRSLLQRCLAQLVWHRDRAVASRRSNAIAVRAAVTSRVLQWRRLTAMHRRLRRCAAAGAAMRVSAALRRWRLAVLYWRSQRQLRRRAAWLFLAHWLRRLRRSCAHMAAYRALVQRVRSVASLCLVIGSELDDVSV
jgi:hypothetical protein